MSAPIRARVRQPAGAPLGVSLIAPDLMNALTIDRVHDLVDAGWQLLHVGDYEGVEGILSQAREELDALYQTHHSRFYRGQLTELRHELRDLRRTLAEVNPTLFGQILRALRQWAWPRRSQRLYLRVAEES